MRNIIIGDIHGCSASLRRLLDSLKPDPGEDRVILLGDLFDRGPDSRGVFRIVQELGESFGERFILLRGNHEDYLLQKKLSSVQMRVWEGVGRGTTVQSFQEYGEKMEDAIPWFARHTRLYYKGENFWCVHAGLKIDPPEINDTYTLLHDHDIVFQNRYQGPLTITGHVAIKFPAWFTGEEDKILKLSEEKWYSLPGNGIICIDTGCGKGGRLTGMVIEEEKFMLRMVPEE